MTKNEKRSLYHGHVTLTFSPALPCGTAVCMREATSGSTLYDPALDHWHLFPLCLDCAEQARREQAQQNAQAVLGNDVWPDK